MKKFIYLFLSIFFIISLCGFTEGQKIYDKANLLTKEEINELETEAIRIAKENEVDVIILTVDDAKGKTSMQVADNFYDENGFGYDEVNKTGILFLIDMDNRDIYISTYGEANPYFTTEIIDIILDDVFVYLSEEDFYNGCITFLESISSYMWYVEPEKSFKDYFLIYLTIATVIGTIATYYMFQLKATEPNMGYTTYIDRKSVKINREEEKFVKTVITERKIEKNNNNDKNGGDSSTHTSDSGKTHGGGGRDF